MKALLFHWGERKRYIAFIVWGLVQGVIVYLVLFLTFPRDSAPLEVFAIAVSVGGTLSAVVFGLLLKAPRWLQSVGFLIVAALVPVVAALASQSLFYHRLEVYLDPLAVLYVIFWTACTMPFGLLVAVLYFIMWLVSKRKQDATPSANSGTPSAELNG